MALPLSYNIRNLRQRWKVTLLAIFGIGLVVAAILFLWHKFRPIREEDVHNKRPLGLG